MTTPSLTRERQTVCDTSFWSIKFIKDYEKPRELKSIIPSPTNMEDRSVGDGGHAPGDSPVSDVSPSRRRGRVGHDGASSGRPDNSRASSELARVFG